MNEREKIELVARNHMAIGGMATEIAFTRSKPSAFVGMLLERGSKTYDLLATATNSGFMGTIAGVIAVEKFAQIMEELGIAPDWPKELSDHQRGGLAVLVVDAHNRPFFTTAAIPKVDDWMFRGLTPNQRERVFAKAKDYFMDGLQEAEVAAKIREQIELHRNQS